MRILHTADWHVGNFNGPTKDGENLRFLDLCGCLDELVEGTYKYMPDLIVIAGDLFHQAKVWSDRGLRENRTVMDYIAKLAWAAPVFILRGTPNHDSAEQFENLKTVFKADSRVHIVDSPQAQMVETVNGEWVYIAAIPGFDRGYFRANHPGMDRAEENAVFSDMIDSMILGLKAQNEADVPTIFVSHYTVEGANMESGQTAFFSQFEPCIRTSVLQTADYDLCLFGHIHRPQQLEGCRNAFYSGAVCQLNFNDEGQPRGYYIHDINEAREVTSEFAKIPGRQFWTLRMDDAQVGAFNTCNALPFMDEPKNKIVRVMYSCTDEHNKGFNKKLLEQQLYEAGAFWVQEITPEKIEITTNKKGLSEDDNPEDNLIAYLTEKGYEGEYVVRIADRARPIISEAIEKALTVKKTGSFIPVEIEVKNYRNYRDERFSFDWVQFCTINGENGAGKSSLFMDAMCDCLFEETREGDISGWISNSPDARSGAIKFTFKMGEAVYRVTRTRMKSGKATLNLAELVDGEWTDRSREKMKDTQAEILATIGMDSLTLKATALIMQDQYGLFLTADKDSRMAILGNILGLGMYDDMYTMASHRLTDAAREVRTLKDKTAVLLEGVPDDGELKHIIDEAKEVLEARESERAKAQERADSLRLALSVMEDAEKRIANINSRIAAASSKKLSAENGKTVMAATAMEAQAIIDRKAEIEDGVKRYHETEEKEKTLLTAKAKYDDAAFRMGDAESDRRKANAKVGELRLRQSKVEAELQTAEAVLEAEASLIEGHNRYVELSEKLDSMETERQKYEEAMEALRDAKAAAEKARRDGEAGTSQRNMAIAALRRKAELLDASQCQYAEEVRCIFLKDAVEAKEKLPEALKEFDEYQDAAADAVREADKAVYEAGRRYTGNYTPEAETELREALRSAQADETKFRSLDVARVQKVHAEEQLESLSKEIDEAVKAEADALAKYEAGRQELEKLEGKAKELTAVRAEMMQLKHYLEDEKRIPVAEVQKENAMSRIAELTADIMEQEKVIAELTEEKAGESKKIAGITALTEQSEAATREVADYDDEIQMANRKIGELEKSREDAKAKRERAAEMVRQTNAKAQEVADLDILKQAFSQDGIPHNIVRSVIPVLEATATNILGQMSGGKMAVEFVMEKTLKSNSKKEVTALDVIINDVNTGRLPYMSRSGGERVKSALAVILALAEIKSMKAGVQVGFLFIDEPPFLDANGVSAYCDALEAIQKRYSDLKVMAITHDPEMKSRFPQSVDIVKTDEGSKVIYA